MIVSVVQPKNHFMRTSKINFFVFPFFQELKKDRNSRRTKKTKKSVQVMEKGSLTGSKRPREGDAALPDYYVSKNSDGAKCERALRVMRNEL